MWDFKTGIACLKGYNYADPVEEKHEDIVCRPAIKWPWYKKKNENEVDDDDTNENKMLERALYVYKPPRPVILPVSSRVE